MTADVEDGTGAVRFGFSFPAKSTVAVLAFVTGMAGLLGGAASHGLGEATAPPDATELELVDLNAHLAAIESRLTQIDARLEELARRVEPLEEDALRRKLEAEIRQELDALP